MKRLLLILCLVFALSAFNQGLQAQSYFDAGFSVGRLGGYLGFQWSAGKLTMGPRLSVAGGREVLGLKPIYIAGTFRVDYHYSRHIDALPEELDLYGGLSAGIAHEELWKEGETNSAEYTDDRVLFLVQAGARWYFAKRLAAHVELNGGPNNWHGFGSIGLTLRMGDIRN